jgi:ionotropic glutamate receptor NMDA 2B
MKKIFFVLIKYLDLNITFVQSVWLSWVILFRAPAKINHPKGFTSKFMTNIWACFCLAFTASYTANLAAFMITKDVHFELSGINDYRVCFLYIENNFDIK